MATVAKIPIGTRKNVWKKRNGGFLFGKCYVCKEGIDFKNFECGNILAKSEGGSNDENNLEPICGNCNKRMGAKNLNDYISGNYPSRKGEESFFEIYGYECPLCCEKYFTPTVDVYEKISDDFYICKNCYGDYYNLRSEYNKLLPDADIKNCLEDYKELDFDKHRQVDIKKFICEIKSKKLLDLEYLESNLYDINKTTMCHLFFLCVKNYSAVDHINNMINYVKLMLFFFSEVCTISKSSIVQIGLSKFQYDFMNYATCKLSDKSDQKMIIIMYTSMYIISNNRNRIEILESLMHFNVNKGGFLDEKNNRDIFVKCLSFLYKERQARYGIDNEPSLYHLIGEKDLELYSNFQYIISDIRNRNIPNDNISHVLEPYLSKVGRESKYGKSIIKIFDEITNNIQPKK